MKPLRLRDSALAALDGVCSRLRCCTPLPLCDTLIQRLRCCPIPPLFKVLLAEPSRSVLHCEQESYYHRLLSQREVHSHYSPAALVDLSHRCSLASLSRSVRRLALPAIGFGNTPCRSGIRNKRVPQVVAKPLPLLRHTLSTAGAVVRYLPLPKPHLGNPSPSRSTLSLRAIIAACLFDARRCAMHSSIAPKPFPSALLKSQFGQS